MLMLSGVVNVWPLSVLTEKNISSVAWSVISARLGKQYHLCIAICGSVEESPVLLLMLSGEN